MRISRAALAVSLALVAVAACGGGPKKSPLPTGKVVFRQGAAMLEMTVEVAAKEADRETGLMGRRSLGAGRGMLFLFTGPTVVGFYMKDTLIPLDIAFIYAGKVNQVAQMVPCKATPCPVTIPDSPFDAALEADRGTFAAAGIGRAATFEYLGTLPTPA